MAKLTKDEEKALADLEAKRDAPDNGRNESVNITIDLGDEKAVRRAVKSGLLPESALDEIEDDDDDADADDGKPRRAPKAKPDAAPRRRLGGADRWATE